ncbi:bifunctional (p)ppGpp synthetase/guanosine-3',5'-bis(diphosphate) 3'-pyrophosphohydrolase [Blastococcus sp. CT_GayMR16]|uniref:RelA/SpoT family protein n=1 Tax=Blastococcus sp. CT_GayMR16 TaxID=2559607 RepID=UPI00107431CD|nr:bifunctional (p)ppGpp synthetase/guanosine-3',5'-bis(diphosphate) 3'-pyrophosphohydrolase [Blastococcus sp. CT_GayMR16]TFV87620.1 bifunctional (p)ppGpp synthetase/guanosine-3',5'-bis(diphosphate) 3'-pyrophosphohydrolase [Blastococcus sp. CT_GayMR16]
MASEVAADAAPARPGEPGVQPSQAAPAAGALDADGQPVVRPPLPDRPVVRRPDDVGSEPGDGDGVPRRRVRDRLARRIVASPRTPVVRPVLEPLAALHRQSHPKADLALLQRAYDVAEAAHAGQKRKSGDPYITHPLAVATVLAGLGMDTTTLVAALLHDTVEDTGVTLETITTEFGSEVTHLVDGVTKIDKVKLGDAAQAETIRKMIVAMARDPRVLVIKLADRLHNMRTLRFLPPEKQEKKARETLEILAPLAHRLGMNTIKWELEDLAFATLYPKRYDEIVRLVAERAPSRDTYLAEVTSTVNEQLKTAKIEAVVTGRPKHYYSIYQKMIVRGRDFTDIWDLVGIRILVDSVRDCYAALGIMHAHWQPVPGRFKDFVAMPKFNMYQSLHTTVIGPQGKPVELQIRTHDMHRTAEYGIAAHWKYKEKARVGGKPSAGEFGAPKVGSPDDMLWLRQLLDWQREAQEPGEFLETLRYDLGPQEVFVFTPKGDVISLPGESTPVDFAFAVHTEVGYRTIGARVNGSLVSLDSKLTNGDVVEIFTSRSESAAPSQDWLQFVGSSRARTKIRQWFTKERREDAVEAGKEALTRAMRKAGLPLQRLLGGDALSTLAKDLRYADVTALYAAVGENHVSASSVVEKLLTAMGGSEGAVEDIAETAIPTRRSAPRRAAGGDPGVDVHGMNDVLVKLAKCCTPVPGDEILGFVTRGGGVSVHRVDCTNAADLQSKPERLVEVEWASAPGSVFLVAIQVEALDRHRLLSDVTKALADERVNILSASVQTSRDRVAISRFTFELADPAHLGAVLQTVRNVDGVFDVERVTA